MEQLDSLVEEGEPGLFKDRHIMIPKAITASD